MAVLMKKDENRETLFNLGDGEIRIGRAADCGIHLCDCDVSHRHAKIFRREDSFMIKDEDSLNGIFINGRIANEAILHDGDRIRIGRNHFTFYEDFMNRTAKKWTVFRQYMRSGRRLNFRI